MRRNLRWREAVVIVSAITLGCFAAPGHLSAQPPVGAGLTDPAPFVPFTSLASSPDRNTRAASELRAEEHQRILGLMPNFNTSNVMDAEPLDRGQKFDLAAKGVLDPFTFVAVGLDAALSQSERNFPGYRQGFSGYAKRYGASYADNFTSGMIGGAVLPAVLKQDPRYFRRGSGPLKARVWSALLSSVVCKNDNGAWAPNYSGLLGNVAAGAISNLYYPPSERGLGITLNRAATLTVEGAIGNLFFEFWPDISHMFLSRKTEHSQ